MPPWEPDVMDEEHHQRRRRKVEQPFLGRHGLTIIVVTAAWFIAGSILSLIA